MSVSLSGTKATQRWLGQPSITAQKGLANVFGRPQTRSFALKALLEPFGLTADYTDHWGAYPASGPRVHRPGQTEHAENRAQAFDVTDAYQALGAQDHLLFEIDADA